MATVDARLASLRKFLESHASGETVFIVEGGGEFHTSEDPFSYLLEHGAYTPRRHAHCSFSALNRGSRPAEPEPLSAY